MTITIPKPRLLLAILAILALLLFTYTVTADDDTGPELEAFPVGPDPELPRVTEAERDRAIAAVENSPLADNILTGRNWQVDDAIPNTFEGEKEGMALIITVQQPFDSSGPWLYLSCQGVRTTELESDFIAVQTIGANFNDQGELIGFRPLPVEGTQALPARTPYPTAEPCPPGREDKEN